MKSVLIALLLLAAIPATAQTISTCPTATTGAAWAAGTFLPCTPAATYIAQPVPATAWVSDMRCPIAPATGSCVFSWQFPANVLSTDQVWAKTTAVPAGTWISASLIIFAGASPPATKAQAVLTWVAPTLTVSGAPLPAGIALTYNVYRGASATTLAKLTNVSALTYTDPAGSTTPTTYFYAITATCATCTESADSGVVSATIIAPALQAAPPTGLASH
jgi:hypothetical protein